MKSKVIGQLKNKFRKTPPRDNPVFLGYMRDLNFELNNFYFIYFLFWAAVASILPFHLVFSFLGRKFTI